MTRSITKQKAEPKLSVIRKGYWRNRWWTDCKGHTADGVIQEPGEYLSSYRWPSAEMAEQKAEEIMRQMPSNLNFQRYLGPVFFPGDAA